MTTQQLKDLGYVERNGEWHKAGGAASRAEPQSALRDEPLAATPREAGDASRVRVSVVSYRARLCDPDNLCPKYRAHCLHSPKWTRDDSPEFITLEVRQVRCARHEQRTELLIA